MIVSRVVSLFVTLVFFILTPSSVVVLVFFFFFKQKTAYEMLRSLVGSEMCIRDSLARKVEGVLFVVRGAFTSVRYARECLKRLRSRKAVSYTHLTLPTIYSV